MRIHSWLAVALLFGCKNKEVAPAPAVEALPSDAQLRAAFAPLPDRFESAANPSTPAKVALGRMLYYDTRVSKNQDLSCDSCHDLAGGGADQEAFSKGHKGQLGGRNAPTVFNAAGQLAQFWDGRAPDVEEQAKGPLLNPVEMAMPDGDAVMGVVRSMPGYVDAFAAAFPGESQPMTYDNFGRAIGAFERGLVTPTRFDRYLAGDDGALTSDEKRGLATFVATGCVGCHNGALVGGGSYQRLGLVAAYPTNDPGRAGITHLVADQQVFKVPMLRNVADTAPYFHDGSIADLPTAVRTMARVQLGKQLDDPAVSAIVTFLGALSGRPDPSYIARPSLPPSTAKSPHPDPT